MTNLGKTKSDIGIYHIVSTSAVPEGLFQDDEDRIRYLNYIYRKKREKGISLLGYCLMKDHVHLLISQINSKEDLSVIMKGVNTGYAKYYNGKYCRFGYVFLGRYKTEPINSLEEAVSAISFVHNNPIVSKVSKNQEDYRWSSYNEYTGKSLGQYADVNIILNTFGSNRDYSIQQFMNFSKMTPSIDLLESVNTTHISRDRILSIINKYLENHHITLESLNSHKKFKRFRNELICKLCDIGLSDRKVAMFLKIGKSTVNRIKNQAI